MARNKREKTSASLLKSRSRRPAFPISLFRRSVIPMVNWSVALSDLFFIAFAFPSILMPCFSQETKEPWRWQTFTVQDGLASNRIRSIWGDEKGDIWIGTRDGWASRYDGRTWRTFTSEDGLAQSTVLSIWGDGRGHIWFGTMAGLSLYDGEMWRRPFEYDRTERNFIAAVWGDEQDVWIGIWDNGVRRYNGESWEDFTADKVEDFASVTIQALWVDRRQRVWVGTSEGLSFYERGKWSSLTGEEAPRNVSAIRGDGRGNIWVSSYGDGLMCYGEDRKRRKSFAAKGGNLPSDDILALWVSERGDVWIGTESDGLAHYTGREWETYTVEDGLANNTVRAIWCNDKDAVWVGTDAGVSRYGTKKIWDTMLLSSSAQGSSNDSADAVAAQAVCGDKNGNIWVGTSSGLKQIRSVFHHSREPGAEGADRQTDPLSNERPAHFEEVRELLPGRNVRSVCEDREGNIWAGTDKGIVRIVTDNRSHSTPNGLGGIAKTEMKSFTTNDGLLSNHIRAISEDSEGNLWVGTDAGVNVYHLDETGDSDRGGESQWISFTKENTNGGLPSNNVSAIWCDNVEETNASASAIGNRRSGGSSKGDVWITTDGGLACYKATERDGAFRWLTFTKEKTKSGLPSNKTQTVWGDSQGNIWLGVHDGPVFRYNGKAWQPFPEAHNVRVIVGDAHDTIWFAGDQNLSRYDGAYRQSFDSKNSALIGNIVNAIYCGKNGSVFIGTDVGLSIYSPQRPEITIDCLETPSGKRHDLKSIIALDYYDNDIRIIFSVTDMASRATDIIYKYKLESVPDVGSEWEFMRNTSPREKRENVRRELQPGAYVFRVRAGNKNLDYSQEQHLELLVKSDSPGVNIASVAIDGQICPIKEDKVHETLRVTARPSFLRNSRQVEIRFVGRDDRTPPEKLSCRYWIEDQHEQSSNVVDEPNPKQGPGSRFITAATSLRPGDYRFHVRVRDSDGNRSVDQSLVIEVPKPWGINILFYAATAFFILFIIGPSFYSGRKHYKVVKAVKGRFNPYRAGEPIRDDYMFFGRNQLLRNMVLTLHNNSIMLHGERRIGKTSVLHHLKARLEELDDPEYDFIPVFIDLQGISEADFFPAFIEDIIDVCEERMAERPKLMFDSKRDKYTFRDFERDVGRIIEALQANSSKNVKLLLLMDEADAMHEYEGQIVLQQLRRIFMQDYTEHISAVMAGVNIKTEWKRHESPFYNLFNEIRLMPFSHEEAERLIKRPVKGIYGFERTAVSMIIDLSGRRPHKIQRFCLLAINRILDQKRRRVRVKDIEYLYRNVLSKEFSTEIDEAIELVNDALVANRAEVVKDGKVTKVVAAEKE